jgi:hypothetical protein
MAVKIRWSHKYRDEDATVRLLWMSAMSVCISGDATIRLSSPSSDNAQRRRRRYVGTKAVVELLMVVDYAIYKR